MLSVLVTRPLHQTDHLSKLIISAGGTVFSLPVFDIQPVSFTPINPAEFDYFIFLSANAVTHFFSSVDSSNFYTAKIIAIGLATQRALENYALKNIICPGQFSSEGILQLDSLQSVYKKNILIVSGINPKLLLQKKLLERKAIVTNVFCYQRKTCFYSMKTVFSALLVNNINAVISTSSESFMALMALFIAPEHHAWLLTKTLCVINETMKMQAMAAGFSCVVVAKNAADVAIVNALLYM